MTEQEMLEELLAFFKALADENRLKIVGLLAQRAYTVEDLADTLGISVSTASHHLSRLAKAGLVSARADGHYYEYSLQIEALRGMAQRLLKSDDLPRLSQDVDLDAYDRKVMATFVDSDGRINAIPKQEKKYLVLLHYVAKAFQPGVRYSEKQVNEALARFHPDTALLRRNLVDYHLMGREKDGEAYWILENLE
jgi:predicted transcriptional regulator